MCTGFWWGNLKGKSPLGRPRLRWEDNIKMDLEEQVAGAFEYGNELAGVIKCGEFFD